MAGGPTTPELVIASSNAGAMGSVGAAYYTPQAIAEFAAKVRVGTDKPYAINLFIQYPQPHVTGQEVDAAIKATAHYRAELGLPQPKLTPPYEEDFDAQFEAVLKAKPNAISFVFGILKPEYVKAAHAENIILIGTATTPDEAMKLEGTGIDAITLQGFEAGGHRGIFDAKAKDSEINISDLLMACKTKIKLPLIVAGGIMTSDDIKTALSNGAAAVQMGTAFLACKEAGTSAPYREKLKGERKTKTTRVFSGRFARGIENCFMLEMEAGNKPILPFQAQNKFTRDMRSASVAKNSADFLSLWAGTGKGELWEGGAAELIKNLFASKKSPAG